MNSPRTWICGLVVVASLIYVPDIQAQSVKMPGRGTARRLQQPKRQQSKRSEAYLKALAEWQANAQAEALKLAAEKKAEVGRRKEKFEADRQARAEKNKQHNVEAATKALERSSNSAGTEKSSEQIESTEQDAKSASSETEEAAGKPAEKPTASKPVPIPQKKKVSDQVPTDKPNKT